MADEHESWYETLILSMVMKTGAACPCLFTFRGVAAFCLAACLIGSFLMAQAPAGVRVATTNDASLAVSKSQAVPVPWVAPVAAKTKVQRQLDLLDPMAEGWDTEAFNDAAGGQLKALAKWIEHPEKLTASGLAPLVGAGFSCQSLRPKLLVQAYSDSQVKVRRAPLMPEAGAVISATEFHGAEGLERAVRDLASSLGAGHDIHAKFKLFHVQRTNDLYVTRLYFEAANQDASGGTQQSATWRAHWTRESTNAAPRLQWIGVDQLEQSDLKAKGGHLFSDITESVIRHNPAYSSHILPGLNYWLGRVPRLEDMSKFGNHGIAVGDVNGDGLEDVYFCEAGGLPNRLFVQNPDGTATDRSAEAGVDWLEYTSAALMVDLDNDGDQDMVFAKRPNIQFARNDGHGHFTLVSGLRLTPDPQTLAAVDYDNDGLLDIFVCGYRGDGVMQNLPSPVPYQDANNGGRNLLLRNRGHLLFEDVTEASGLNMNNTRYSFAASWEDYDNDGDLDLYVANDFGRNNLYRNDSGHFTDVAAQAGVEDVGSGMSVSWADYNRDGWMDLYVGNMFSSAGNRIAFQRKFVESQADVVSDLRRMARGNTLFSNLRDSTFVDVSEDAAVTMGRWAWSSKFVDLNNDGWEDIVVANGFITGEDPKDL